MIPTVLSVSTCAGRTAMYRAVLLLFLALSAIA
jgi:hypothetical protein